MSDSLKELTPQQLAGVLSVLEASVREARQKMTKALGKTSPELRAAWVQNLSSVPPGTTAEMAERVKAERRRTFEKRLLESPEAYVAYQVSCYLLDLQAEVRSERTERLKAPRT